MKIFNAFITLALFSIISFSNTSCSDSHAIENAKLDTLEMHLAVAKENLNIDIKLIKERATEIETNRNTFLINYKDTFSSELGSQLDKYKAIMKIYNNVIKEYNKWSTEYDALSEQITNLRYSVNKGELNREEFKSFFYKEEADILALRDGSAGIKKTLYELEPEYIRLSEYVDDLLANSTQAEAN